MREDLDMYYTMKELCKILRGSRGRVYGMVDKGKLPQPCKIGGKNLWPKKEIKTLLDRIECNR